VSQATSVDTRDEPVLTLSKGHGTFQVFSKDDARKYNLPSSFDTVLFAKQNPLVLLSVAWEACESRYSADTWQGFDLEFRLMQGNQSFEPHSNWELRLSHVDVTPMAASTTRFASSDLQSIGLHDFFTEIFQGLRQSNNTLRAKCIIPLV